MLGPRDFVTVEPLGRFKCYCYRWYCTAWSLRGAWQNPRQFQNAKRFNDWVWALKSGRDEAVYFFAELLKVLLAQHLPKRPDVLVSIPRHQAFDEVADSPVQYACDLARERLGIKPLRVYLLRKKTLPSALEDPSVRSLNIQKESLEVKSYLKTPKKLRILIVDDVLTSGSHMTAACELMQQEFSRSEVFGLAFGRTCGRPNILFPDQPDFESLWRSICKR